MQMDRRNFLTLAAAGLVPWDAFQPAYQPAGRSGGSATGSIAITITGLAGLTMQGNKLAVVMPDALKAGLSDAHEPRLYVDKTKVATGSSTRSGVDTTGTLWFWSLAGYRLTIAGSAGTGVTNFKPVRPKGPGDHRADTNTTGDVGWIPSMARIRNKHGLNGDLLAEHPPEIVLTQAFFDDGELMSTFPHKKTNFANVEFKFDPAPSLGAYQEALGDATLVRPVSTSTVTFVLTPMRTGSPKSVIVNVSGDVEVTVRNSPTSPHCSGADAQKLTHFAAYYALVESSAETDHPTPVWAAGETVGCGSAENELIRCPPMRY